MKIRPVYVAGRFRDSSPWLVHQNAIVAEQRAAIVTRYEGLVAVCPHLLTKNLDSLRDERYWCEATLEIMRRCDALFVGPGWEDSRGTLAEIREALQIGKPVFFEENQLRIFALQAEAPYAQLLDFAAGWFLGGSMVRTKQLIIDRERFVCTHYAVDCDGTHFDGMGTLAWAIAVTSFMRAGGWLDIVPGALLGWINYRIVELDRLWKAAL